LAIHEFERGKTYEIEVRVTTDGRVGIEGCSRLLRDINTTQALKQNLSGLAADEKSNVARANVTERRLSIIVVPSNVAWLIRLAGSAGNWGREVELGKGLGNKDGNKRSCEDRREHIDKGRQRRLGSWVSTKGKSLRER